MPGSLATGHSESSALQPGRQAAAGSLAFVLPGIGAGGSEHVVTMLCNHFAGQGRKVSMICFEPVGTKPFYPLSPAVELVCLGYEPRRRRVAAGAWSALQRYRLLLDELRRQRPALVISFLTRTNVIAALAGLRIGIPVIVSERNNPQRQPVGPVWGRLRRIAYGRAAALVTMTSGAGRCFPKVPGRADIVIPNHARMPQRPEKFDPAGRRLVAVGRLVEQKGFDLLIDAFARIAGEFPDWQLVIWGEGPLREALEGQRAALGLQDRIAMPGVTARPGDWVTGANLFVLSSRFEGWGLVVGEAMAAGIPAVSFDCPFGPGDMIVHGQTGLLAPDQDVAGLADALAQAMANPELRRQLAAAGREAMKDFVPARILGQWDQLVRSLADGRPGEAAQASAGAMQ